MASLDAIIDQLQARGERMTIQRRLVVEALCAADGHISAAEVERSVRANHPEADLPDATIYRILQWLKALEVVSQTDMGTGGIVYELLLSQPHHHLICLHCGAVTELDDRYLAPLRQTLDADFGFRARIDHMAIYGLCALCAAKGAVTAPES